MTKVCYAPNAWFCSCLIVVTIELSFVWRVFFNCGDNISHYSCISAEIMLPENAFRLKLSPRWCNAVDGVANIVVIWYRHLVAALLDPSPRPRPFAFFYKNCFDWILHPPLAQQLKSLDKSRYGTRGCRLKAWNKSEPILKFPTLGVGFSNVLCVHVGCKHWGPHKREAPYFTNFFLTVLLCWTVFYHVYHIISVYSAAEMHTIIKKTDAIWY